MAHMPRPPTSFAQPFPTPFITNQSFPTVDIHSLSMFPVSAGKSVIPIPTLPSEFLIILQLDLFWQEWKEILIHMLCANKYLYLDLITW